MKVADALAKTAKYLNAMCVVVGAAIALFAALNLACYVYLTCLAKARLGSSFARDFQPPPYWDEYNHDTSRLKTIFYPFVFWRIGPPLLQGSCISIDAHCLRSNWQAPAPRSHPSRSRIFVLGGSTVWGQFARSDYTLPSFLARAMAREGLGGYQVTNFGQPAYVSTQEVITLLDELHAGRIPSLVIFLDGINDTFSAYQNGRAGLAQNQAMLAFRWEHPYKSVALEIASLLPICRPLRCGPHQIARVPAPHGDTDLPEQIVSTYLLNMRFVVDAARDFGFKVLFYWQPDIYSKVPKTQYEYEAEQLNDLSFPGYKSVALATHALVQKKIQQGTMSPGGARVKDLSASLNGHARTCFMDAAHPYEDCNGILAEIMERDVKDALEQDRNQVRVTAP